VCFGSWFPKTPKDVRNRIGSLVEAAAMATATAMATAAVTATATAMGLGAVSALERAAAAGGQAEPALAMELVRASDLGL
jgi:hypothetical protein